jgi:hypothetical protein
MIDAAKPGLDFERDLGKLLLSVLAKIARASKRLSNSHSYSTLPNRRFAKKRRPLPRFIVATAVSLASLPPCAGILTDAYHFDIR